MDVELRNGLQMQLVMTRTTMLGVTGTMGLVVVTTLTKPFVHFVNALALSPQIHLHQHLHHLHLLLMDVELRNGLQMQLVMMKIIMLLVTLMMELVVVTTLTKLFVQNVNVLTQIELIFMKSLLESNENCVFEFRNTPFFFKIH
jgi:hypothetical protein